MGRLLNEYLQTFGPSLSALAQGAQPPQPPQMARPGMEPQQRQGSPQGGAQTFPIESAPRAPQLQFQAPTFTDRAELGPVPSRQPQPALGGGSPDAVSGASQATFEGPAQIDPGPIQEGQRRRDRQRRENQVDPENVKTVDDLWSAADEEQIDQGVEILSEQLGGEEGINRAYSQLTGKPADTSLSKREKAQLLMEFGLNTLALNDQMSGLGAIGAAGSKALGTAREMRQAKAEAPAKARKAQLENELIEMQIQKAKADPVEITTNADGQMVLVNKSTGNAETIRDTEGNPVTSGEEGREFASEVDRAAYESLYCDGLSGDALKECKKRALAYSKGGAATIAFPELSRERIATTIWNDLRSEDQAYTRHTIPSTGESKRWRDLSPQERIEVADQFISETLQSIRGAARTPGAGSGDGSAATGQPPVGWDRFNITEEQARQIKPGTMAVMSSGRRIANIGGRLREVDEQGRPINQED